MNDWNGSVCLSLPRLVSLTLVADGMSMLAPLPAAGQASMELEYVSVLSKDGRFVPASAKLPLVDEYLMIGGQDEKECESLSHATREVPSTTTPANQYMTDITSFQRSTSGVSVDGCPASRRCLRGQRRLNLCPLTCNPEVVVKRGTVAIRAGKLHPSWHACRWVGRGWASRTIQVNASRAARR